MPLSHHPLVTEFPEYKDIIHRLKMEDPQFHALMEKYEELDKQIFRIEDGSEPSEDAYVEELKKQRLALKDEVLQLLKAH
jgi:uncharacterized protein YdcH (DUF465 family)